MNPQQISSLLQETGPETDIQGIVEVDQSTWVVAFEEELIVEIHLHSDRKCLLLETELGTPDEEHRLDTYESALVYSSFLNETGGIRIVLDAPSGNLMQHLDLFTEDLDSTLLTEVLDAFVEKARAWKPMLAVGGITLDDLQNQQEAHESQGIRV